MTIINSLHILLCCRKIVPAGNVVYFYVKIPASLKRKGVTDQAEALSPVPFASLEQEIKFTKTLIPRVLWASSSSPSSSSPSSADGNLF